MYRNGANLSEFFVFHKSFRTRRRQDHEIEKNSNLRIRLKLKFNNWSFIFASTSCLTQILSVSCELTTRQYSSEIASVWSIFLWQSNEWPLGQRIKDSSEIAPTTTFFAAVSLLSCMHEGKTQNIIIPVFASSQQHLSFMFATNNKWVSSWQLRAAHMWGGGRKVKVDSHRVDKFQFAIVFLLHATSQIHSCSLLSK